jgi:DNA-binding FrmR family transcriptional regulator
MAQQAVSEEMLLKRLKRIEGQVRGIQKMIENGRDCESVITQLAAVHSAIEGVGALMLNNYMKLCFREGAQAGSTSIDSLARAVAIWGRLRVGEGV